MTYDTAECDAVRWALEASDDAVGPACMNVVVPPTIATDEHFREIYSQGYRHALAAARAVLADGSIVHAEDH